MSNYAIFSYSRGHFSWNPCQSSGGGGEEWGAALCAWLMQHWQDRPMVQTGLGGQDMGRTFLLLLTNRNAPLGW